ncbi:MAG TPA: hypothetical protein VGL71_10855, partial [Urbifossiella sp.]
PCESVSPENRVHSAGLLSLVFLLPAAPPAAGTKLQRGDEMTYRGTVAESVDRPNLRFRRTHELEVRVFVLERSHTWSDAAVLTLLRRVDDGPVASALVDVTGRKQGTTPPGVRLDLVRIHDDGAVHLLAPRGPGALRLAADTPARLLPAPPLDSFAPFEFGMIPPPHKPDADTWQHASTDVARPVELWSIKRHEFINSEHCTVMNMVQQTADWATPRGGQTSWQRADEIWVPPHGLARRVHRSIRQRDGIADEPALVIDVKYDLQEQGRPIGRSYDRYRSDIEAAYLASAEMAPLLKDAARLGSEPFKKALAKLDEHLEASDPATPYREAVLAVRRQLDAARNGETITLPAMRETAAIPARKIAALGRMAPDIQTGSFHLKDANGKPVVLIFFMPKQQTTELSLSIAEAMQKKFGSRIAVVPLAVFASLELGIQDRDRLKLAVPVYDGSSVAAAYGVETFPRFFAIDGGGVLRWQFNGVGGETGFLLREQVESLLSSPAATVSPARPGNQRPPPRP